MLIMENGSRHMNQGRGYKITGGQGARFSGGGKKFIGFLE
jgi:hypothetical protein